MRAIAVGARCGVRIWGPGRGVGGVWRGYQGEGHVELYAGLEVRLLAVDGVLHPLCEGGLLLLALQVVVVVAAEVLEGAVAEEDGILHYPVEKRADVRDEEDGHVRKVLLQRALEPGDARDVEVVCWLV